MRNIFVKKLIKRAKTNKKVFLLTGDLGYNCFEAFKKEFPNRFINIGVAENNMMGIGIGLALSGKEVYIYSIIPFLIYRSLEHIRNYITSHNLNIKLIGAGGGFSYGPLGLSHNPVEDINIIKTLPNISIFNPGTEIEANLCINEMFKIKGSAYIRLGKTFEGEITDKENKYKIGNGIRIKKGNDIILITTGNIIENILKVSENLEKKGFKLGIISFPCLKPLNKKFILNNIKLNTKIIFIEENVETGSLKDSIRNILYENNIKINFLGSILLKDKTHNQIGDQKYLRLINGLSIDKIEKEIIKLMK